MERLLDELNEKHINQLFIRQLFREKYDILPLDNHEIRIKLYSLMLLGSDYEVENRTFYPSQINCEEHHVLLADAKRTRQDIEEFQYADYQYQLTNVLNTFCVSNNICYKQGMNDICASIIYLVEPNYKNDTLVDYSTVLIYDLFSAFMFKYMERYCCLDNIAYLQKSYLLFDVLVKYHDPIIASCFDECQFNPELYATSWFLTQFSRSLPVPLMYQLLDMLIVGWDDPALTYFIGLGLLIRDREVVLDCLNNGDISDVLVRLNHTNPVSSATDNSMLFYIADSEDLGGVLQLAEEAHSKTPRCFVRCLRLCCVASATSMGSGNVQCGSVGTMENTPRNKALSRTGSGLSDRSVENSEYVENRSSTDTLQLNRAFSKLYLSGQDEYMERQAFVSFVIMTAHELISTMATSSTAPANESPPGAKAGSYNLSCPTSMQHVMIDIRSANEIVESGNVLIPKAYSLDPDCLQFLHTDADFELKLAMNENQVFTSNNPGSIFDDDDFTSEGEIKFKASKEYEKQKELFYQWIQLFDGMKCDHICIIDMPDVSADTSYHRFMSTLNDKSEQLYEYLANGENIALSSDLIFNNSNIRGVASSISDVFSKTASNIYKYTNALPSVEAVKIETKSQQGSPPAPPSAASTMNPTDSQTTYWSSLSEMITNTIAPYPESLLGSKSPNRPVGGAMDRDISPLDSNKNKMMRMDRRQSNIHTIKYKLDCCRSFSKTSLLLVNELQKHGFKYVSVLDGGIISLISSLLHYKGVVEPSIINYEPDIWEAYLLNTNRSQYIEQSTKKSKKHRKELARLGSDSNAVDEIPSLIRTSMQLSPMEQIRVAIDVATRLGHTHMTNQLKLRLKVLEDGENVKIN